MVKVTVADVVRRESKDEQDRSLTHHIVVLHDEAGRRALPIWVGAYEGQAIALGVSGETPPRPMTYNFIASLLDAANVQLEEVRVEALKDEVFYAVAKLRQGETLREVDARPSDAIALALRVGAFAHTFAWARQRDALPEGAHPAFDPVVPRRALVRTLR